MKRFEEITISQIDLYQTPIKLKQPFIISLGPLYYASNVTVVIRTKEGLKGFGECSPFMTINGETIETCFIVGQYLGQGLIGKNALDISSCSAQMDNIIFGNSSIKSAFDIALYDIAAQNAGKPLYSYLKGDKSKTLLTDYTVSLNESSKMVHDAMEIKERGFNFIKVKLGDSPEKDIERIRLIRDAIGNDIPIRVDANQGWGIDEAIQTLIDLEPFNIQYCEEPIARWNFMQLSKIKKSSPIPIMADESCCDHHDAKRLIDLKACDMFNIKLGKSSGFYKALKIIKQAEAAGIKMQVGGFLESRLGFTASAHLALSSPSINWVDFDSPLMFTEDPVIGGIKYQHNGVITVPDEPGLGAKIDEVYLQGLTKATIN